MLYNELTPQEQTAARKKFLDALNLMEEEQSCNIGKKPSYYTFSSALFKEMLPESEWERYTDENGVEQIRRI